MIWAQVELVGTSGEDPGFMVTTKAVTDKVLYMADDTVSWRRPRVPQPRLDWTEVAFELSFKHLSVDRQQNYLARVLFDSSTRFLYVNGC